MVGKIEKCTKSKLNLKNDNRNHEIEIKNENQNRISNLDFEDIFKDELNKVKEN